MEQVTRQIKRALISVTDKTHLDTLVKKLSQCNVELISTGGTKTYLENLGYKVTSISKLTGNPEAFGGRMKSISFAVTSALLFRRYNESDLVEAKELNIEPIDLVICNLYPFSKAVSSNASEVELIENIDIGGPLMLRAAAKNYESVTVLSSIEDYDNFLSNFDGSISFSHRRDYAVKTFDRIAQYDVMIANELTSRFGQKEYRENSLSVENKKWLSIESKDSLRYGENPHQKAHLYQFNNTASKTGLIQAEIIQGKELSYNNWIDADSAWRIVSDVAYTSTGLFVTAVIKHANPCGLCVAPSLFQSLVEAWNGDSVSSFGGVLAFSSEVDGQSAQFLCEKFVEVVIAPGFSDEALKLFAKKKNVRLINSALRSKQEKEIIVKSISGGLLIQEEDDSLGVSEDLRLVTKNRMSSEMLDLVDFGILACKHLKSNGIALVGKNSEGHISLVGTGMGQPNRLDSLRLLAKVRAEKKNIEMNKLLLVSDAFFPFADSIEVCHEIGISSIVQPGGSIRDDEVINACDQYNIAMVMTGKRHFRH